MRRNDKGIVVPDLQTKLPLCVLHGIYETLCDKAGSVVANDLVSEDDAEFLKHAANYHERIADIVRLLAEFEDQDFVDFQAINSIVVKASKLWSEYQEDAPSKPS